jgi:hypothetical protein
MPRYEIPFRQQPGFNEYFYYLAAGFPKLIPQNEGYVPWWVIGNSDPEYNCIDWTLGYKQNVGLGNPQGVYTVEAVDDFYVNAFGYRKVDEQNPVAGPRRYDVAAYGPDEQAVVHVAVYLSVPNVGDTWTSKMGAAQLITHYDAQLIPGYGATVPAYYTHEGTEPQYLGAGNETDFLKDWFGKHGWPDRG